MLEENSKKGLLMAALQTQVTARPGVLPADLLDAADIAAGVRRLRVAAATASADVDSDFEGDE